MEYVPPQHAHIREVKQMNFFQIPEGFEICMQESFGSYASVNTRLVIRPVGHDMFISIIYYKGQWQLFPDVGRNVAYYRKQDIQIAIEHACAILDKWKSEVMVKSVLAEPGEP